MPTSTLPYGLGWRPDLPDRRDLKMKFDAAAVAALPSSNPRFSAGLPPIWDQGSLGACTAFAILRCHNFAAAKDGMKQETLSCLQLYYDERAEEGTIESDAGAMIRTGIKILKNRGCGLQTLWPYVISRFKQKPPAESYKSGMNYQAIKFAAITPTLEQIKAALHAGYPIVCGWPCYESLASERTTKTGDVPFPGLSERMVGGHATVLNGFWDDASQRVGMDNSWSPNWGLGGLGTLPYRYFVNGMVSDCWLIYKVEGTLPHPEPEPEPLPIPTPTPPIPVPPKPTPDGGLNVFQKLILKIILDLVVSYEKHAATTSSPLDDMLIAMVKNFLTDLLNAKTHADVLAAADTSKVKFAKAYPAP